MVECLLGEFDPPLLVHFGTEREPGLHRASGRRFKLAGLSGFDQCTADFNRELQNDLSEPEDDEDLAAYGQALATKRLLSTNVGPTDEVVGEALFRAVGVVDYASCSLTT